jgi:hypothetical protein
MQRHVTAGLLGAAILDLPKVPASARHLGTARIRCPSFD